MSERKQETLGTLGKTGSDREGLGMLQSLDSDLHMENGQHPSKEAPLATCKVGLSFRHHRTLGISVPTLRVPVSVPSPYSNPKCLYVFPDIPRSALLVPAENQ